MRGSNAGVAQLVERNLAKVEVESSRLFSRSTFSEGRCTSFPFSFTGGVAKRLCSGLQSRLERFDSASRLHIIKDLAHSERVQTGFALLKKEASPSGMASLLPHLYDEFPAICKTGSNGTPQLNFKNKLLHKKIVDILRFPSA